MSEVAVTDKREKMANQLLMRGHATMRELLEMSFGEWPVKGLEIDPDRKHEQGVRFIRKDKGHLAAVQPLDWRRAIRYNNQLAEDAKSGILSLHGIFCHEAAHVLQNESVYWKSDSVIVGLIAWPFVQTYHRIFKKTQAEKIAGKFLHEECAYLRAEFNGKRSSTIETVEYLAHSKELQARLHEVMAEGYQDWSCLPKTKYELLGSFVSAGVLEPSDIPIEIEDPIFLQKIQMPIRAASEISYLLKEVFFTKSVRGRFVNEILPALYVNLLELYGDKNARQRFGLDENYKPIKQVPRQTTSAPTPSLA